MSELWKRSLIIFIIKKRVEIIWTCTKTIRKVAHIIDYSKYGEREKNTKVTNIQIVNYEIYRS